MKLFMIVFVGTFIVLSLVQCNNKEIQEPVNNYSAFEEITPEELMKQKLKFEEEMKRIDNLIHNNK